MDTAGNPNVQGDGNGNPKYGIFVAIALYTGF